MTRVWWPERGVLAEYAERMSPRLALGVVLLACVLLIGCASGESSTASAVVEDTTTVDETSTSEPPSGADDLETGNSAESAVESTTSDPTPTTASTSTAAAVPLPQIDACVTQRNPEVGSQTGAIASGGNEYGVLWTVPSSYDGTAVPLVIDFHALGSNGGQQNVFAGFGALAEVEGFVAVNPTGLRNQVDDRVSWELPEFDVDTRDDVAFVTDLIDYMATQVCVDQERIFATGMSNGGLFTSVLVCELSDRIRAAASVAGVTHDDSCSPSRAVPYLAFHGTADTVVPYAGGGESTLAEDDGGSAFFEQVMPDEFAEFADSFRCDESVDTVVTSEISLRAWSGCDDDVEVGFYTIDGGGHTWPGSDISSAFPALGVTNMDIDATQVIWDFFARQ